MSKIISVEVFTYDELEPKAQEKARDWYRRACEGDNFFAEHVIEDAVRMAEIMGIELADHAVPLHGGGTRRDPSIWWSLGYSQSDGVWIEGTIRHAPYGNIKIREEAPKDEELHSLADRIQALQGEYGDRLRATFKDDERRPIDLDAEVEYNGQDEDTAPNVTADTYAELRSIVRDFERWIYNGLRAAHEYQDSDECIADNIRGNEYTFRANGERFDG